MLDGFTNDCCRSSDGVHDVPLGEIAEGYECFDIFAVEKNDTNFSTFCVRMSAVAEALVIAVERISVAVLSQKSVKI